MIGHMDVPLGQTPDQKGVDIAKENLATLGFFAHAGDIIKNPLDLCSREISICHQASARANFFIKSFAFNASQMGAVRRLCQTIALKTGFPVAFSQTTVVSRWFVIPMAATSAAAAPAFFKASWATANWLDQIASGSCSTRPGAG